MNDLMNDLRASVMLEALEEMTEIADNEVDITDNGGPNSAMRIVQIARAAIAKVRT